MPRGVDALVLEIALGGGGAPVAEGQVVLVRAALVGVAADLELDVRVGAEDGGLPVERRLVGRADGRLVVLEVDHGRQVRRDRARRARRPRAPAARAPADPARRCRPPAPGAGVGAGAGVGSGAGCSGAGFPPQAAASPAVARTNNREGARIRTPRSRVRERPRSDPVGGTTQGAAPRQASGSWRTRPVSTSMTQSCRRPLRSETKVTCRPSGPQVGSSFRPDDVSCRTRRPATSTRKSCGLPETSRWNTTLAPSGDHSGAFELPVAP